MVHIITRLVLWMKQTPATPGANNMSRYLVESVRHCLVYHTVTHMLCGGTRQAGHGPGCGLCRHDHETPNGHTVDSRRQGLPAEAAIRAPIQYPAVRAGKDLARLGRGPGNGDHHIVVWSWPGKGLPATASISRASEDPPLTLEAWAA